MWCKACEKNLGTENFTRQAVLCNECKEKGKQYCKTCEQVLTTDCFHQGAIKCKECRAKEEQKPVTAESKKRIKLGANDTKTGRFCDICKEDLELNMFGKNRNQCKECRKIAHQKKLAKPLTGSASTITEKPCNKCQENLPISEFGKSSTNSTTRKSCKKCTSDQRKKNAATAADARSKSEIKVKPCTECRKDLKLNMFGENRNQCKKCRKIAHQKRLDDREPCKDENQLKGKKANTQHTTNVHRIWFEKNKEFCIKYRQEYNSSIDGVVRTYASSSKSKNLNFEEKDAFRALVCDTVVKKCFYCGYRPGEKEFNGIDRINSQIGYIESNCVPCCMPCNYMKNSMDVGSFLRKVREIAIFNKDVLELSKPFTERIDCHPGISLVGNSTIYSKYKCSALKKKKKFDLSKEKFEEIVSNPCYLCGLKNSSPIGIDRKDDSDGYTLENSFACCSYCNYMKKNMDYVDFLTLIKIITMYSCTDEHKNLCKSSIAIRSMNQPLDTFNKSTIAKKHNPNVCPEEKILKPSSSSPAPKPPSSRPSSSKPAPKVCPEEKILKPSSSSPAPKPPSSRPSSSKPAPKVCPEEKILKPSSSSPAPKPPSSRPSSSKPAPKVCPEEKILKPSSSSPAPKPLSSRPSSSKPAPKVCPEGKVVNPASGRCVSIDSRVGKTQVPRVCPEGKVVNPASGRCVSIDSRVGKKHAPKVCPEGKVVNPASGRCVSIDSRVGKTQVPRVCPEGKVVNPASGRCVSIDSRVGKTQVPRVCPEGKVVNPASGRCVSIDSRVGKTQVPRVCPEGKVVNPASGRCVSIDSRVGKKHAPKVCPEGKVVNPDTGRCVSIDSRVGKKLLSTFTKS